MYVIEMPTSTPYKIIVKNDLFSYANEEIKKVYSKKNLYVLSDERVGALYLKKFKEALKDFQIFDVIIEGYEKSKSLETYAKVCEAFVSKGITRGDMIVALGGGVIGDLAGFVAATLYRGIPFIQIPTSLLAQVDSSIGGKTGIDFMNHKNILGSFHQPKLVLIDPLLLKSLPERQLKNGYGEMIKHAMIGSPYLYSLLEKSNLEITEEIIYENLLVKRKCVLEDEFDKGERMKLNFGHTFGHIIELTKEDYLHGEAVLDGMLCAISFGIDKIQCDKDLKQKLITLYNQLNLPYHEIDYHTLINQVRYDKKNFSGKINFIFVPYIGKALIKPMNEEEFL